MQMLHKREILKKCEELYVVMNSVNDINPMLLTVFFVVLYCCACRREFQFLPGCFFLSVVHVPIDYFTVVCSEIWPSDGGEAGVDLVLIQTSLLLLCKTSCFYAN